MKYMEQQFSIIDVFCGIGGMSKGFLDAGYRIREAVDLDKEKVSIYNNIFGENIAKCQDLCSMNPRDIKDADIIVGGMLLNDFSIVGQKRGEDYHPLNKHMINLVYEKKPKAIVLETAGIVKNSMHKICDSYVNMGYHIYDLPCITYCFLNVPYISGPRADFR